MKKRKDHNIDPDSMIGQAVVAMVGSVIALKLLDELVAEMHLRWFFKEEGYKLFNCRM